MADFTLPPRAQNGLTNPFLFEQRKFYKDRVYPYQNVIPLDMLYEKPFYGKVDIYGNPVYPSETYMEQLGGQGFLTVLNFVADAFRDFKGFMDARINGQETDLYYLFKRFRPVGGSTSIHDRYHKHFIDAVFQVFINEYMVQPKFKKKVNDFSSFTKEFIKFCDTVKYIIPITKLAFSTSTLCPNSISGLFIELEIENYDNDRVKYEKFISNPGFSKYIAAAATFGFYVDKNAPWRIAANLDSPQMLDYMAPYGIHIQDNSLFKEYFYKTATFDYEGLKRYLYNAYRTFLIGQEKQIKYEVANCIGALWEEIASNKYRIYSIKSKREVLPDSYEEFEKIYDDSFFIPIYFDVRLAESNTIYSEHRYKAEFKKIMNFYKIFGVEGATSYITNLTQQTRIYEKPPVDSKGSYKIKYFGKNTISGLYSYTEYGKMDEKDKTATAAAKIEMPY